MLRFGIVSSLAGAGRVRVAFDQLGDAVQEMPILAVTGMLEVGDSVACIIRDNDGICLGRY